jgi:hypothetical protein
MYSSIYVASMEPEEKARDTPYMENARAMGQNP